MKKPQYTKYSVFSITFLGPKSSAQILKKEFLEVAYNLSMYLQIQYSKQWRLWQVNIV